MKKILLAFDGTNFSEGAFQFVSRLNEMQPLMVTGAFLPSNTYANLWSYSAAFATGAAYIPTLIEEEPEINSESMEHFKALCEKNGIKYKVHEDFFNFTLPELVRESRFADLLVLSGEKFYEGSGNDIQFDYLKEVVHSAECPVIILPEAYDFPEKNIIAYDGGEESVYALKQFAYLFPEFANNPTVLVYAEESNNRELPQEDYAIEWATQHFSNLEVYKLELDPKKYFNIWIRGRKKSMLICGSYSRSAFSELFKKSFVSDVLKDHNIPVFIAHK